MFYCKPFVDSLENWVTVWIGDLNEEEMAEYLDELGGVSDNEPISKFSKDLGRWYDHDFIWCECSDDKLTVLEQCINVGIESNSLQQEIINSSPVDKIKSILILWNSKVIYDLDKRVFAGGQLICLGSWSEESPLTD